MSKKPSQICRNWPKYLLQWGVLAVLILCLTGICTAFFSSDAADPERFCPFGGIQAFVTYLVRGSLPCSMSSVQILMGLALAAAVILFSKLFCGYLCPVGTVEDLLTKLRKALKIKGFEIASGTVADKLLRIIKYALLFWILYMTVTASELFCKKLDPYYAVATGFKGEITLWMSIVTVSVVLLMGLFVKRFWCKYICPLGAISNTLKFWMSLLILAAVVVILALCGVHIPWVWVFAAVCLLGYLLEIFSSRPRGQILHVIVDQTHCGRQCYSCQKNCPYHINVPLEGSVVRNVDCVLCGECVATCPSKALSIGLTPRSARCGFMKYLPAILTAALLAAAILIGGKFELPTIDENWGIEEGMKLETVKIENLKSVKCYGSSMAFKARMEGVKGVHGVKTYVTSHSVVIKYDPAKTTAEKIQEEVFVPSHFRVNSPDPKAYTSLKVLTIRTEKMYDRTDLNRLGMQFRLTGKKIYGIDSQYDCPLIVRVYVDPEEEGLDEAFFRETVNRKTLDMPVHGGGVKSTPIDIEFVRMEKEVGSIDIKEYLEMMFDGFKAEYKGKYTENGETVIRPRAEVYAGKPQFFYELVDQNYEKPIIKRVLPFLSNHVSKEEGVIGTYLCLNADLLPCIRIRYAAPMTEQRLWELITMPVWTITYKEDDVREEGAKMTFDAPGTSYRWTE